jgi:hypothetical protein
MSICEFDTKINNGFIRVPEPYEKEIDSMVKVILIYNHKNTNNGNDSFFNFEASNKNITKTRKKHKTLKQRLVEFYGENYDTDKIREEIKEIDWGKPVGNVTNIKKLRGKLKTSDFSDIRDESERTL